LFDNYKDGFINVFGVNLYYKIYGHGKNKMLILHGGPGGSHDYLLPLSSFARENNTVIFYDQCGCGKSEEAKDLQNCARLEYYVEEVEEVRKKLAKDKIILLGHSWGGLLALAYAIKYQNNLKGLIVSSGLSSVPLTVKEMRRLIEKLPEQTKNTIYECERNNDFSSEKCTKAVNEFYIRHLFMFHRFPDFVQNTFNSISNRKIYKIMNGPTEFEITGSIKDIDITNDIKNINIPTLILVGEHDEVTPRVAQVIHDNIKNSLLYVIPNSSHLNFLENPKYYYNAVNNFLKSITSP